MRLSTKRLFGGTIAAISAMTYSEFGSADIPLNAGTIHGTVQFTNTNPDVLAILTSNGMNTHGMSSVTVKADSVPSGYNSVTSSYQGDPTSRQYQLSAEANNVTYEVMASANVKTENGQGEYRFKTPDPIFVSLQPNIDVQQDFENCVGITHFRFGNDSTCATPVTVSSGHIYPSSGLRYFAQTTEHHLLLPDGTTNEAAELFIDTGTDPTFDLITIALPQTLNATCDVIQDACIDMSPYGAGSNQLGSLTGPFDVIGEVEQGQTYVQAWNGPSYNSRARKFSPPEMPESDPSSWWVLPNMVPGNYNMFGDVFARTGRQSKFMRTFVQGAGLPSNMVTVVGGQSSNLQRMVDGQPRYPFVMAPARFQGSIRLVHHPASSSASPLSTIFFGSGANSLDYTKVVGGDESGIGVSLATFDGGFDSATGEFNSNYEQLVVNAYDVPTKWAQYLRLEFQDSAFSGSVWVQPDETYHLLGPNDTVTIDHEYCFSEVNLRYTIANATMFNPTSNGQGTFQGTDWRGVATEYKVYIPYSSGWPKDVNTASSTADIHFALPQGTYTLQPGATIVAADGSTSTATFAPINLQIGCNQTNNSVPGLSVATDQLPECADSSSPLLTGTVSSNNQVVDRIWYTINGGAEVDICPTNCGLDPSYSIPITLNACENTIEVFASVGAKTASITSKITWDDPNDGNLCPGACGTPPPDPTTCSTITAEPLACSGNGETYDLTFTVTNNTLADLKHVLIPDSHVSPHAITLSTPLAPGESTTVTVSVQNVNPGSGLCMDIGVSDSNSDGCCSQEVCVEIPACCFSVESEQLGCVLNPDTGEFTYSFDFKNRTLSAIEHVYVFPPNGVTVSPDYVDVPTTPPGGIASVGPLLFSGAAPGDNVCVTVGIHDEDMNECCAEDVCFTAPSICPIRPPNPTSVRADSASCTTSTANDGSFSHFFCGLIVAGGLVVRRRRYRGRAGDTTTTRISKVV